MHKKIRNRSQKPEPFLQFISFSDCVMDGWFNETSCDFSGPGFEGFLLYSRPLYRSIPPDKDNHLSKPLHNLDKKCMVLCIGTYLPRCSIDGVFHPQPLLSISRIHNKNAISITAMGRAFVHSRDTCARRTPEEEERVKESTHWRL